MITRPRHQAGEMQTLLEAGGAVAYLFATVEIVPLGDYAAVDAVLTGPGHFDWLVLSSGNGVAMLRQRAAALGLDPVARFAGSAVAAVGERTAADLRQAGFEVALMPASYEGEALADALIQAGVAGRRVLCLRSQLAREVLVEKLQAAGAEVTDLALYSARAPEGETEAARAALAGGRIDVVSFTSASALRNFCQAFGPDVRELLRDVRVASIGPVTSALAYECLGRVDIEPVRATVPDLVSAMLAALAVPV